VYYLEFYLHHWRRIGSGTFDECLTEARRRNKQWRIIRASDGVIVKQSNEVTDVTN
jgi:hypothetical protein